MCCQNLDFSYATQSESGGGPRWSSCPPLDLAQMAPLPELKQKKRQMITKNLNSVMSVLSSTKIERSTLLSLSLIFRVTKKKNIKNVHTHVSVIKAETVAFFHEEKRIDYSENIQLINYSKAYHNCNISSGT